MTAVPTREPTADTADPARAAPDATREPARPMAGNNCVLTAVPARPSPAVTALLTFPANGPATTPTAPVNAT
ncbi:hypothetical protein LFT48_03775 [Arthrobacter sp. FW305-123]|nr:hypothetical protein LFT48_03755 [Arthrobacter sp. FW305-123]UKA50669.1 hypothetical protein LFT48_03775 [Arthrobacter sp. FW305-123]